MTPTATYSARFKHYPMHLSVTQFFSLVFFGSNTTAISIGPASSGMAAHDFHGMLAQFQEGIILISRCRMEWGSLSATNLVALVPGSQYSNYQIF